MLAFAYCKQLHIRSMRYVTVYAEKPVSLVPRFPAPERNHEGGPGWG